jgi:hypothetical protein
VTAYSEADGFIDAMQSNHLVSVQCESCHGPGRDHVTSMTQVAAKVALGQQPEKAALPAMITTPTATLCLKCHDPDNSPAFNYEKDLPLVSHKNARGPFKRTDHPSSATMAPQPTPFDIKQLKPNPSIPIR